MMLLPFRFEHVDMIEGADTLAMRPTEIVKLEGPNAFSGFVDDKCVGCAGVVKIWPGRYQAWAYIARDANAYMLPIVRATRNFLRSLGDCRVEAAVAEDFPKGRRFAQLVGMERETPYPMAKYLNGKGAYLYAYVSP